MRFTLLATASALWISDPELQAQTSMRAPVKPIKIGINLDDDPGSRWKVLEGDTRFKNYKQDMTNYIGSYIPKSLLPLVADIVSGLRKAFYPDYAAEMEGLATALGVSVGDIVIANLIYQLENIGVTCDQRNVTGPCPARTGPGLCTGVVVNGRDDGVDEVWQGRNLDWNLDATLLQYVLQVDYTKSNQTLFTAIQIAGEVGILHGMRKGAFSVQLDARDEGGSVVTNLLELIAKGAKTPTHVMRRALETAATFDAGVDALSGTEMANPAYFIVAGVAKGEGAIISMDRKGPADTWHLYEQSSKDTQHINPQQDWFRLQTNYDHWTAAPDFDDRRTPGVANVAQFCGQGVVDQTCVAKIMSTWPTMNHHTDVTTVMCPRTGFFDATVWINATSAGSVLV